MITASSTFIPIMYNNIFDEITDRFRLKHEAERTLNHNELIDNDDVFSIKVKYKPGAGVTQIISAELIQGIEATDITDLLINKFDLDKKIDEMVDWDEVYKISLKGD